MSGEGARRYGGRWNSIGRAVVYLGDSLALAGMGDLGSSSCPKKSQETLHLPYLPVDVFAAGVPR